VLENSDFRLLTTYILLFLHKAKRIYDMVNKMVASTAFRHCWLLTIQYHHHAYLIRHVKHQSTDNETRTQSIAQHLQYPRPSTRSEASGITVPSAKKLLHWKSLRKAKQKDDLEMENGRRIRQDVCRGRRLSADKDIRQPVLLFVRFS